MNTSDILKGVRVLAIETQVAAPYCTMMLADQGAEVLKIERPGVGDAAREMAPILKGEDGKTVSGYFARFNRNKKSIALDFTKPEGLTILKKMIAESDIIVENNRPGTMEKAGLTWEVIQELNPKVVYVAISGFGRLPQYQSPFADRPAYDIIAQAMGGLMHLAGQKDGPPTWLGVAIGDIGTGMYAAYAALLGYIKSLKTGVGTFVDISMYDCMVALAERSHNVYSFTGKVLRRGPDPLISPWGPFPVKDGYIAIICATEKMWEKLCKAMDRADFLANKDLSSGPGRAENMEVWMPALREWLSTKTMEEATELFLKEGMPCGPVQSAVEVANCPHIKAREMLVSIPDPVLGSITVVGSPIKMNDVKPNYAAIPQLGENTDGVLKELLNYDDAQLELLRQNKVI